MKLFKTTMFLAIFFVTKFAAAQNHNTLWCDKNQKLKNTHNAQQQKTLKTGEIIMKVKWGGPDGASTLTSKNLEIVNGVCKTCPNLGAIGSKNYEQLWTIQVTDISKPVDIAWATPGTINHCGSGRLRMPPASFK